MKRLLMAIVVALSAGMAWALPTVQEVQAQVQAGHYDQAQTMMGEVVAAKPGSAKAHYLYAEILAHNKQFDQAAEQARLARSADPAIGFTEPEKFRAFERLLAQEQRPGPAKSAGTGALSVSPAAVSAAPAREGAGWHVPGWAWVAGGLALAALAWRAIARSFASPMRGMQTSPAMSMGGAPGYATGGAYGPGYQQPGLQPGYAPTGGNTALRTGMAVAGGVAAGMLLDNVLRSGGHEAGNAAGAAGAAAGASTGLAGGMQPGFFDADASSQAASQLEERPIDFGNGGDWDSGGSDGGSSGDDGGW